jgi:molybdopterin molybdotransferase
MRPGKPLMSGRIGDKPMLGMPGNPVSSLVCGLLFLRPAILTMLGATDTALPELAVRLGTALKANDRREDYLRCTLSRDQEGNAVASPFPIQDSSMLSRLVAADCLVIRPPHAPAAEAGSIARAIPLTGQLTGF